MSACIGDGGADGQQTYRECVYESLVFTYSLSKWNGDFSQIKFFSTSTHRSLLTVYNEFSFIFPELLQILAENGK